MRIGELSKRSGFSRDAIRFYERSGLINAETREAENNYKTYPEDAVFTLEVVRDAQAAGMSIEELTIFMKQLEMHAKENIDGDAFLAAKITEVEERINASERFLETLKEARIALAKAPFVDE